MTATVIPTSATPTVNQVWARGRGPLLAVVVLLAAGIALAALSSGGRHGRLDPRSADPEGSRAIAQLLQDRGVSLTVVSTLDQARAATGPDTTLLVADPDLLTVRQQKSLRASLEAAAGTHTVLVGAGPASVPGLAPGVHTLAPVSVSARAADCDLPAARRAGRVDIGGQRYTTNTLDATSCYPSDGISSLLRIDSGSNAGTVLLGSPDILFNDRLDKQGNASLALQLLGSQAHLVWYLPSLGDPSVSGDNGAGQSSFFDLVPSGWIWGAGQLLVAALLAAVWRARRLGPLVTERLPVAIRASEAAEGRARLYRKANARDRAGSVLRAATRDRLAPLLGVPATAAHSPEALLPAVSARLRTAHVEGGGPLPSATGALDLRTLLFGSAPTDDAALINLANQLDTLEREVRTS